MRCGHRVREHSLPDFTLLFNVSFGITASPAFPSFDIVSLPPLLWLRLSSPPVLLLLPPPPSLLPSSSPPL